MKINLISEIKKINKDFVIAVFDKEELERNAFFALLSQNDRDYIFDVSNLVKFANNIRPSYYYNSFFPSIF